MLIVQLHVTKNEANQGETLILTSHRLLPFTCPGCRYYTLLGQLVVNNSPLPVHQQYSENANIPASSNYTVDDPAETLEFCGGLCTDCGPTVG